MSSSLVATPVLPNYPKVFACTIADVFSPEECDELIKLSEDRGYEAALVNVGYGQQELMTDFRNNDRCIIDDEARAQEIYKRIEQFVPEQIPNPSGDLWERVSLNERLRFLRYGPEQEFKPHMDGCYYRSDGPKKGELSLITIQLYLNEVEKGGETTFFMRNAEGVEENIAVNPKKGMVILFQHQVLHSGSPVVSGMKYVIRSDIMYKKLERKPKAE